MKSKSSIVIAFEGFPFSGKTSLLRNLREQSDDVQVILETDYQNTDSFQGNGKSLKDAITSQEWHFMRQIFRYSQVENKIKLKIPQIIIERGYYSELAYSIAYSEYMKFNLFEYVLMKTEYFKKVGLYIKPDAIIIINASFDSVLKRNQNRIYDDPKLELPEFWFREEFYYDYVRGLDNYIDKYEADVKKYVLNGENNLEDSYQELNNLLTNNGFCINKKI